MLVLLRCLCYIYCSYTVRTQHKANSMQHTTLTTELNSDMQAQIENALDFVALANELCGALQQVDLAGGDDWWQVTLRNLAAAECVDFVVQNNMGEVVIEFVHSSTHKQRLVLQCCLTTAAQMCAAVAHNVSMRC